MTLKVVDRFTTQDGKWYPTSDKYGISVAMWEKYPASSVPGAGAATHIMVNAPVGSLVTFVNSYNSNHRASYVVDADGWVDMPMAKSSAYKPLLGERGPWMVLVNGVKVADGIGLPESWHVSTFLIVKDVADITPAPVPVPPVVGRQYIEVVIRTMRDGLQIGEQVVWKS